MFLQGSNTKYHLIEAHPAKENYLLFLTAMHGQTCKKLGDGEISSKNELCFGLHHSNFQMQIDNSKSTYILIKMFLSIITMTFEVFCSTNGKPYTCIPRSCARPWRNLGNINAILSSKSSYKNMLLQ